MWRRRSKGSSASFRTVNRVEEGKPAFDLDLLGFGLLIPAYGAGLARSRVMARVGRLAGAILAESKGRWFLVGNTKEPCDFRAEGFEPPAAIDALKQAYVALTVTGAARIDPPCLTLALEGDELAQLLARRFLIKRNGSVSDRLWRLVFGVDDEVEAPEAEEFDAQWLAEIPDRVWDLVRDSVLRCL